jgi:hypothetical protein
MTSLSKEDDIVVPVVWAAVIGWPDKNGQREPRPFVGLDASKRPDVADLIRAMFQEGYTNFQHKVHLSFMDEEGRLSMSVTFKIDEPVICQFRFQLPWPKYDPFFQSTLEQGQFYITTDDITEPIKGVMTMSVPQEVLGKVMGIWEQMRAAEGKGEGA